MSLSSLQCCGEVNPCRAQAFGCRHGSHLFRLDHFEERQGAADWGTGASSLPGGALDGATSAPNADVDVAMTATTVAAAASFGTKCIGLDRDSSSSDDGIFQRNQPRSQWHVTPEVPYSLQPNTFTELILQKR